MSVTKGPYRQLPFKAGIVNEASFVIGAETANVINVAIQLKDGTKDLVQRASILSYISSDANGDSVVATAPTTVAIGTDGVNIPLVTGKCFLLTSEADGDIDMDITLSSGAATYYLVLVMPDGSLKVSGAITFV
jgi:hypothetical protein